LGELGQLPVPLIASGGRAPASVSFDALGSTAVVAVTDSSGLDSARALLVAELAAIDDAASRFRAGSEIELLNARAGERVEVSELLAEAIAVALRAAELSGGDVDPTLGAALIASGYDRDWAELSPADERNEVPRRAISGPRVSRLPAWRLIEFDRDSRLVRLPAGVRLDLGASAKALVADRAAAKIHGALACGVLVSLGGDIATTGSPPEGGWSIRVTDDHRSAPDAPGQTIAIGIGGLATSSTAVRRWSHDGQNMHHIIDPETNLPVRSVWRTVSVLAGSCVDANTASTASLIRSRRALPWLRALDLPARLVDHEGLAHVVCGWPSD
jgi:thiamine biosynthesis lipoprotein